jgi:hypothetical protein
LTVFKLYRLSNYEEAAGILYRLEMDNELLVAHIGKIALALPPEMEEKLRTHIGMRISILHTEDPLNPYLIRVVE